MDRESLSELLTRSFAAEEVAELDPQQSLPRAQGAETFSGGLTSSLTPMTYSGTATRDGADDQTRLEAPPAAVGGAEPARGSSGFEIVDELGKGGMGVVYRARQRSLNREVAIKTILGAARSQDRERFISEARVTGFLDHPNIVPVYELGAAPEGEPMLAMKLVGGTEWKRLLHPKTEAEEARAREYELEDHLGILINVCNALRLAHDRGIAHCDLKPENVMVGEYGEVMVMDWGIAVDVRSDVPEAERRCPPRSTIKSPCGTPCYMAPELAEGRGEAIDARTDVYLLGAILYEILERRPLHQGASLLQVILAASDSNPPEFKARNPVEIQAICRRAVARDPADRHPGAEAFREDLRGFLKHRESQAIAAHAQETLDGAVKRLEEAGGLEARPEPRERDDLYRDLTEAASGFRQALRLWKQNAEASEGEQQTCLLHARAALRYGDLGLAESQSQYLDAERPEAAAIREEVAEALRQQARAKRLTAGLRVGGLAALGAALISLTLNTTESRIARARADYLTNAALAARDRAERERRRAGEGERIALEALGTLIYDVSQELDETPSSQLRQLRARFLGKVEGLYGDLERVALRRQDLSQDTANLRLEFGRISEVQGKLEAALKTYQESQSLARQLAQRTPDDPRIQKLLIQTLIRTGDALRRQSRFDEAAKAFEEARALSRAQPDDRAARQQRSNVLERVGQLSFTRGDLAEASEAYTQSLELRRSLVEGGGFDQRRSLTLSLDKIGDIRQAQGKITEALAAFNESLELRRRLLTEDPENTRLQHDLGFSLNKIGDVRKALGDLKGALESQEESLALFRELERQDPGSAEIQELVIVALKRVGDLQLALQATKAAEQSFRASVERSRRQVEESPEYANALSELAGGLMSLGSAYAAQKKTAEALEAYQEALETLRGLTKQQPDDLKTRQYLYVTLVQIGLLHTGQSAYPTALETFEDSLKVARHLDRTSPENALVQSYLSYSLNMIGKLRKETGDVSGAAETFKESIALARRQVSLDGSSVNPRVNLASFLCELAVLQREQGELQSSESLFQEALDLYNELAKSNAAYQAGSVAITKELEATRRLLPAQAFLEGGARPAEPQDHLIFARLLVAMKDEARAVEHFRSGFVALSQADTELLVIAARAAARASASVQEGAEEFEQQACVWLAEAVARVRKEIRDLERALSKPEANKDSLRSEIQGLRQSLEDAARHPDFGGLKERPNFVSIFSEEEK